MEFENNVNRNLQGSTILTQNRNRKKLEPELEPKKIPVPEPVFFPVLEPEPEKLEPEPENRFPVPEPEQYFPVPVPIFKHELSCSQCLNIIN